MIIGAARARAATDAGCRAASATNVVAAAVEDRPRPRAGALLGTRGATVWLTGLPGSGKSTIAAGVEARLVAEGVSAYRLDGDNLRHGINGNLGFSAEDRAENVRRTAHVARLLADAGTIALVSLVSPYAADRDAAREIHEAIGLDSSRSSSTRRWRSASAATRRASTPRARAGEISGMTGVDDPYEAAGRRPTSCCAPGDARRRGRPPSSRSCAQRGVLSA